MQARSSKLTVFVPHPMARLAQEQAKSFSIKEFLCIALWWGLLTGLGEGYLAPSYIWRDLMRAGVELEPLLFLAVALIVIVRKHSRTLSTEDVALATFMFSGLAVFACVSRSEFAAFKSIAILDAFTGALVFALLALVQGAMLVRWQKRTLPVLLALALWCIVGFPLQQRREEKRTVAQLPGISAGAPNVLVIVVDTLRADHLSTYGYARPTSPHLTQLAAQGTLFENAISPSSWTLPAHASLLTGLYPHAHHMDTDNAVMGQQYPVLGEEFMARGYRTAAFSANALMFCRRRGFGRGFIHFEDSFQSPGSSFGRTFYGNLMRHLLFQLELKADLFGRRNAADINRHALRWIDGGHRPFFVVLNYLDVHDPYRPPEPYLHRYTTMKHPETRASESWQWFEHLTPAQRQGAMDAYDGAINYTDDHIQDLMEQLRRRGLDRNTLVVITSDHGEGFGEHGLMNHGNSLYREVIHVPLIFWAPGRIPAGKRIATPVSLTSLAATLLEETGEIHHRHFPQASLAGLWNGQGLPAGLADPISELAHLHWSLKYPNYYGPMESVTTTHWHYIRGGKFGEQLFPCCADQAKLDLADTAIGEDPRARFGRELAASNNDAAVGAGTQASSGNTYHLAFEPKQVAIADFDNDGDLDILVLGKNRDHIELLLGDGKGGFHPASDPERILKRYMALRRRGNEHSLSSLRNTSGPYAPAGESAAKPALKTLSTTPLRAEITDVNGDGLQDVVVTNANGQESAWLRAGADGKFYLTKAGGQVRKQQMKRTESLTQGDIDGNGLQDLAYADEDHNRLVFLLATRPGVFSKAVLRLQAQHPSALGFADLNHNGKADLVVVSRANKSVTVMLGL